MTKNNVSIYPEYFSNANSFELFKLFFEIKDKMRDLYAFNNTYRLLISVTDGNYSREQKNLIF